MVDLMDKAAARKFALGKRRAAHVSGAGTAGHLSAVLAGYRGIPVAGYIPIKTEIDPLPAMAEAFAHGPVGVPMIEGAEKPLSFLLWEPDCATQPGPFGVPVPTNAKIFEPEIVIVPLVAFDRNGGRLGYGGGYYDRTLERLRALRPLLAIGFAYAAQEMDALPVEAVDQPLDLIVTEAEIIAPIGALGGRQ